MRQTEQRLPHLRPGESAVPVLLLQAAYPRSWASDNWTGRNTDPHILNAGEQQNFLIQFLYLSTHVLYQSIPVGNQSFCLIFQILQFVGDLKFKIKNGSLQRHHIGCRFSFIHTEKFKIPAQVKDIEFLLIFSAQYPGAKAGYKALPGSPDIVLTKYKIAIFCDSEFFHGKDLE